MRPGRGAIVIAAVLALIVLLGVLGSIGNNKEKASSPILHPRTHVATAPKRTAPATNPGVPAGQVQLQLVPTSQVYVCLRDASGRQLLNQSLARGGAKRYVSKSFRLTLGNNSVRLVANGKSIPVAYSATPINYSITPAAQQRLPLGHGACP
jgi:hypothetical protein